MQTPVFSMSKERLEKLAHYLESKLKEVQQQLETLNPPPDLRIPAKSEGRKPDFRATTGDKA